MWCSLELACSEDDIACRAIVEGRGDTTHMLDFARAYISEGALRPFESLSVLDIGAHIGHLGLYAAARGHKVYMFEPMVSPFQCWTTCSSQ